MGSESAPTAAAKLKKGKTSGKPKKKVNIEASATSSSAKKKDADDGEQVREQASLICALQRQLSEVQGELNKENGLAEERRRTQGLDERRG